MVCPGKIGLRACLWEMSQLLIYVEEASLLWVASFCGQVLLGYITQNEQLCNNLLWFLPQIPPYLSVLIPLVRKCNL